MCFVNEINSIRHYYYFISGVCVCNRMNITTSTHSLHNLLFYYTHIFQLLAFGFNFNLIVLAFYFSTFMFFFCFFVFWQTLFWLDWCSYLFCNLIKGLIFDVTARGAATPTNSARTLHCLMVIWVCSLLRFIIYFCVCQSLT